VRCPDCQKFVSFDTDKEPEDLDLNVTDDGTVSGSVRIVNGCGECGQDLTEATLDVEIDLSGEIEEHREEAKTTHEATQALKEDADERESFDESEHDVLSISSSEAVRSDRRQTKDRTGRIIKSARYQRQYYGAEVTVTVECKCGETFERTEVFESQASGMESLV
jgi:hypothetical protein